MKRWLYIRLFVVFSTYVYVIMGDRFLMAHMPSYVHDVAYFDRLYPLTNLNRFEIFCKDLWSDLELFEIHEASRQALGSQVEYLYEQFQDLYKKLEAIVANQEEASCFLREDVDYIASILAVIEHKYRNLGLEELSEQVEGAINQLFDKANDMIYGLYVLNKESSCQIN